MTRGDWYSRHEFGRNAHRGIYADPRATQRGKGFCDPEDDLSNMLTHICEPFGCQFGRDSWPYDEAVFGSLWLVSPAVA